MSQEEKEELMHHNKDSRTTLKREKEDYLLQPIAAVTTLVEIEKQEKPEHRNGKNKQMYGYFR